MTARRASDAHLVALDSLRGVAALSVVIYHMNWKTPFYAWGYFRSGYLMVDVFFVLSGFVIALNYSNRIPDLTASARFMWLRFWRLYPLHFTMLVVFLLIEIVKFGAPVKSGLTRDLPAFAGATNGWSFLSNLFLAQSLHLHASNSYNEYAWSISVEFYTYAVFAFIVWARRRVVVSALIISMASGLFLLAISEPGKGLDYTYDFGFIRCLFGFFLGTLSFISYRALGHAGVEKISAAVAAAATITTVVFLSVKSLHSDSDFILPPLAAVLITSIALSPDVGVCKFLCLRPIAWLGKISYSIYMVSGALIWMTIELVIRHVMQVPLDRLPGLGQMVYMMSDTAGIALTCLYVGAVLFASHFTFNYIERPFREWSRTVDFFVRRRLTWAPDPPPDLGQVYRSEGDG